MTTTLVAAKAAKKIAKAAFDVLHPRGADGRFIEKYGMVRFLHKGVWTRGRVEDIYTVPESPTVARLVVKKAGLDGKVPEGALGNYVSGLLPEQVYSVPDPIAHLTTSAPGAKKVGGQAGSNPGGFYELPEDGGGSGKYYVKQAKSAEHGAVEALANDLYRELGVPVPYVSLHTSDDGKTMIYSRVVPGSEEDMAARLAGNDGPWLDRIRRNMVVDAWLANWDVFGMTWDNIKTADEVPYRIDNGGALTFRAQGSPKGGDFGPTVPELDMFRKGKKAQVFGAITKEQELDGAQRILGLSPQYISAMVAERGLPQSMADTLMARRAFIAEYYGLELPEAAASAPAPDIADITTAGPSRPRNWFRTDLAAANMVLRPGDSIEVDGQEHVYGGKVPHSKTVAQAQMMDWLTQHGAGAQVWVRQNVQPSQRAPHHESLTMADIAEVRWERGDTVTAPNGGGTYEVVAVVPSNGIVLLRDGDGQHRQVSYRHGEGPGLWYTSRHDGAGPDIQPEIQYTPEQAEQVSALTNEIMALLNDTEQPDAAEAQALTEKEKAALAEFDAADEAKAAQEEPSMMAVWEAKQAEAMAEPLQSWEEQLLPTQGQAAAESLKTEIAAAAKSVAKASKGGMVIGDGTEVSAGDTIHSTVDGKAYTFVKKKGPYAVVLDPVAADPQKQYLKVAATMVAVGGADPLPVVSQPSPTKDGHIPALGMQAVAADGFTGKITMISPNGKFVFITDAAGKRKRKSVGTVSILGPEAPGTPAPPVPPTVDTAPDGTVTITPPVQSSDYMDAKLLVMEGKDGSPTLLSPDGWQEPLNGLFVSALVHGADLGGVVYADGTWGLAAVEDPSVPPEAYIPGVGFTPYEWGTAAAGSLAAIAQDIGKILTVMWEGEVMEYAGTGPGGGPVLFTASGEYVEIPQTYDSGKKVKLLIRSVYGTVTPVHHLETADITTAVLIDKDPESGTWHHAADLAAHVVPGSKVSHNGVDWLTVTGTTAGGVMIGNQSLGKFSSSTFLVLAPSDVPPDAPETLDAAPAPDGTASVDPSSLKTNDIVTITTYSGDKVTGKVIMVDKPSKAVPNLWPVYVKTGSGKTKLVHTESYDHIVVQGNLVDHSNPVTITTEDYAAYGIGKGDAVWLDGGWVAVEGVSDGTILLENGTGLDIGDQLVTVSQSTSFNGAPPAEKHWTAPPPVVTEPGDVQPPVKDPAAKGPMKPQGKSSYPLAEHQSAILQWASTTGIGVYPSNATVYYDESTMLLHWQGADGRLNWLSPLKGDTEANVGALYTKSQFLDMVQGMAEIQTAKAVEFTPEQGVAPGAVVTVPPGYKLIMTEVGEEHGAPVQVPALVPTTLYGADHKSWGYVYPDGEVDWALHKYMTAVPVPGAVLYDPTAPYEPKGLVLAKEQTAVPMQFADMPPGHPKAGRKYFYHDSSVADGIDATGFWIQRDDGLWDRITPEGLHPDITVSQVADWQIAEWEQEGSSIVWDSAATPGGTSTTMPPGHPVPGAEYAAVGGGHLMKSDGVWQWVDATTGDLTGPEWSDEKMHEFVLPEAFYTAPVPGGPESINGTTVPPDTHKIIHGEGSLYYFQHKSSSPWQMVSSDGTVSTAPDSANFDAENNNYGEPVGTIVWPVGMEQEPAAPKVESVLGAKSAHFTAHTVYTEKDVEIPLWDGYNSLAQMEEQIETGGGRTVWVKASQWGTAANEFWAITPSTVTYTDGTVNTAFEAINAEHGYVNGSTMDEVLSNAMLKSPPGTTFTEVTPGAYVPDDAAPSLDTVEAVAASPGSTGFAGLPWVPWDSAAVGQEEEWITDRVILQEEAPDGTKAYWSVAATKAWKIKPGSTPGLVEWQAEQVLPLSMDLLPGPIAGLTGLDVVKQHIAEGSVLSHMSPENPVNHLTGFLPGTTGEDPKNWYQIAVPYGAKVYIPSNPHGTAGLQPNARLMRLKNGAWLRLDEGGTWVDFVDSDKEMENTGLTLTEIFASNQEVPPLPSPADDGYTVTGSPKTVAISVGFTGEQGDTALLDMPVGSSLYSNDWDGDTDYVLKDSAGDYWKINYLTGMKSDEPSAGGSAAYAYWTPVLLADVAPPPAASFMSVPDQAVPVPDGAPPMHTFSGPLSFPSNTAFTQATSVGDWLYLSDAVSGDSIYYEVTEVDPDGLGVYGMAWTESAPQDPGGGKVWTKMSGIIPLNHTAPWLKSTPANIPHQQPPPPPAPAPAPQAPAAAPALHTPAAAHGAPPLPGPDDIAAWGGSLTKDGYIPSQGLPVTGKGPMTGKIISISKDRTKAVVLTPEGKKTTRLISALKFSSAGLFTGTGAVTLPSEAPAGQYLKVQSIQEAIDHLLSQEGGPKLGAMVGVMLGGTLDSTLTMRVAQTEDGKPVIRAYTHLERSQVDTMRGMLTTPAAPPAPGAWIGTVKPSGNVATGDLLAMRFGEVSKSWKPLPSGGDAPTHSVTKAVPSADGKTVAVTLAPLSGVGPEIQSTFHTGDGRTIYHHVWDPDKMPPIKAGSTVTAPGWEKKPGRIVSGITVEGKWHPEKQGLLGSTYGVDGADTYRFSGADGSIIEVVAPTIKSVRSTDGFTAITVPADGDDGETVAKRIAASLSAIGVSSAPPNQVRLKAKLAQNLAQYTKFGQATLGKEVTEAQTEALAQEAFKNFGAIVGLTDIGWHDVMVGQNGSGVTQFYWSDRVIEKIAAKQKNTVLVKSNKTGTADRIISFLMQGVPGGAVRTTENAKNTTSAIRDDKNFAGHGGFFSMVRSTTDALPDHNPFWPSSTVGSVLYTHPMTLLMRIGDVRAYEYDKYGYPPDYTPNAAKLIDGHKHKTSATTGGKHWTGLMDVMPAGGLAGADLSFIGVEKESERQKAIADLKALGITEMYGRPVAEIIQTKANIVKHLKGADLPVPQRPANAIPLLDVPLVTSSKAEAVSTDGTVAA